MDPVFANTTRYEHNAGNAADPGINTHLYYLATVYIPKSARNVGNAAVPVSVRNNCSHYPRRTR